MKLFEVRVELPKRPRERTRFHEWVAVLATNADEARAKYQSHLDENEKYNPTRKGYERKRISAVQESSSWFVSMGIWKSK